MFKRLNIKTKIILPYILIFTAVIVITSLITINIVYKRMDERIEEQMGQISENLLNMGFVFTDDFLNRIKLREILGVDIIVYNRDGTIAATTISRDMTPTIMTVIKIPEIDQHFSEGEDGQVIREITYLGQPYKVIYKPLSYNNPESPILCLISFIGDIAQAKRRSAITIILVALSGIILVCILGIWIAGSITAPVKQLVKTTEKVAAGDLTAKAEVDTKDEIGLLANSFNQMTAELKLSRDKLIQSEKLAAVGQLAAGIAHDIRNPLTSMKMIVQLLKRRLKDDSESLKPLQAVLDEISRLELSINGLLDFARPMELDLRPMDISKTIEDVLKLTEADLKHRKIHLVKNIKPELPLVLMDENRIKQVLMNIIVNAMQSMSENGELNVSSGYDREKGEVWVKIADTGTGMEQDVLEHVYEPFFSARSGGTGLGLANVKKMIDMHNGNITIKSKINQGTKVKIAIGIVT
ncbi:HAMP domain-containing protein [Candidatus Poribacteria bacterium]|nr:HAMP domain-containing protein [Candidatus Poribacteria bacterium]